MGAGRAFLGFDYDLLASIYYASNFFRYIATLYLRLYGLVTWKKLFGVKPPDGPMTYSAGCSSAFTKMISLSVSPFLEERLLWIVPIEAILPSLVEIFTPA
jgi:hypothetical protein